MVGSNVRTSFASYPLSRSRASQGVFGDEARSSYPWAKVWGSHYLQVQYSRNKCERIKDYSKEELAAHFVSNETIYLVSKQGEEGRRPDLRLCALCWSLSATLRYTCLAGTSGTKKQVCFRVSPEKGQRPLVLFFVGFFFVCFFIEYKGENVQEEHTCVAQTRGQEEGRSRCDLKVS